MSRHFGSKYRLGTATVECLHCHTKKEVNGYRAKGFKFCSRVCQMAHTPVWNKGLKTGFNPNHNKALRASLEKRPGRTLGIVHSGGYVKCAKGGPQNYVREHREVMAKAIGRPLSKKEIVHHWDENKTNNAQSNLALLRSNSAHTRLHNFARRHGIKVSMLKFNQPWLFEPSVNSV